MASNPFLSPGISRELFVSSLVTSFSKHHDTERALLLGTPFEQLPPSELLWLDEASLKAVDDLSFDFPQPSAAEAQALATALTRFTCAPRVNKADAGGKKAAGVGGSLFAREFTISKGFLDGLIYCSARARPPSGAAATEPPDCGDVDEDGGGGGGTNKEEGGEEVKEDKDGMFRAALAETAALPSSSAGGSSSLSAEVVSEVAALVLVKCVKMLLEALSSSSSSSPQQQQQQQQLTLARRLLSDPALEALPLRKAAAATSLEGGSAEDAGVDRLTQGQGQAHPPQPGDDLLRRGGSSDQTSDGTPSAADKKPSAVVASDGTTEEREDEEEEEEEEEEEVWAADLDDDDVPYDAIDPKVAAEMNNAAAAAAAACKPPMGPGSGLVAAPRLLVRLATLIQAFSSPLLSSLPLRAWARLDLARDVGSIVRALLLLLRRMRKQRKRRQATRAKEEEKEGSSSSSSGCGEDDRTQEEEAGLLFVEQVFEEAWVAYAYSLRDHLSAAAAAVESASSLALIDVRTPLEVIFALLDDDEGGDDDDDDEEESGGEVLIGGTVATGCATGGGGGGGSVALTPSRSAALLITHSLLKTLASRPPSSSSSSSSTPSPPPPTSPSPSPSSSLRLRLSAHLREGLLERLPTVLCACLEEVSDSLGPHASKLHRQTAQRGSGSSSSSGGSGSEEGEEALTLLLEQGRVVLACVGFACGVELKEQEQTGGSSSSTKTSSSSSSGGGGGSGSESSFAISAYPPTNQLLGLAAAASSPSVAASSSGGSGGSVFRHLLKLLATLTPPPPPPPQTPTQTPKETALASTTPATTAGSSSSSGSSSGHHQHLMLASSMCLSLVTALVMQDERLCAYALRCPSTAQVLAPLERHLLQLDDKEQLSGRAPVPVVALALLCFSLNLYNEEAVGSGSGGSGSGGSGSGGGGGGKQPLLSLRVPAVARKAFAALLRDLQAQSETHLLLPTHHSTSTIDSVSTSTSSSADRGPPQATMPHSLPRAQTPQPTTTTTTTTTASGALLLAASLGRLPPRVVGRIKKEAAAGSAAAEGWFRCWLVEVQAEVLLLGESTSKTADRTLSPQPETLPTENAGGADGGGARSVGEEGIADVAETAIDFTKGARQQGGDDEDNDDDDDDEKKKNAVVDRNRLAGAGPNGGDLGKKGATTAAAVIRADVLKATKMLLEAPSVTGGRSSSKCD